jgi:hypothetical protein
MPIQLRCSECTQLLRVPDSAAGKKVRCPKCGVTLVVAPAEPVTPSAPPSFSVADGDAPIPPEPIPPPIVRTVPLPEPTFPAAPRLAPPPEPPVPSPQLPPAPWPDPAPPNVEPYSPSTTPNPYLSSADAASEFPLPYLAAGQRPGLPWENEKKTLRCWFRTTGLILGSPTMAFSIMRQYGGLGSAMLYNAVGMGLPIAAGMAIVVPIMLMLMLAFGGSDGPQAAVGVLIFASLFALAAATYVLVYVTLMALLSAAIYHLLLMIVGGANHGYETTFRVFSYAQGAVFWCILIPIPYLNALTMGVWNLVLFIIGMARAHETTGGRVALAVFLPLIICAVVAVVAFAALLAMGVGAAALSR